MKKLHENALVLLRSTARCLNEAIAVLDNDGISTSGLTDVRDSLVEEIDEVEADLEDDTEEDETDENER